MAVTFSDLTLALRFLAVDAIEQAQSGHPGMPLGMADVATVLFERHLKFNPDDPHWPDRDRFILSAGHGSMLQYALLHLLGYPDMTLEQIKAFRQWGSLTPGHPEYGHTPGIETTTGPLGQGLGNAVGMALAEVKLRHAFGDDLVDHYTYVVAGDGCLMEGISHEVCALAGHLKLGRLIVLFDDNQITIDGATDLARTEDIGARFRAMNWHVLITPGHEPDAIDEALKAAKQTDLPTLIMCKTTIGKGAPNKAGTAATHGSPLGKDEVAAMRKALDWPHEPFEIPQDTLDAWRTIGQGHRKAYNAWQDRLKKHPHASGFSARIAGALPPGWQEALKDLRTSWGLVPPALASRQASQKVLEVLNDYIPALLGGSADLTPSNNTQTKTMKAFQADNPGGRYVHYGVREHGMGSIMNGLAVHGGFIPYGGTFLVFSDYMRPAMRLSALMKTRVIYVMTHDSIALGEDGPTHQPIEHLASLRAIPDLNVMRPADATETVEAWMVALEHPDVPSVIALSRQTLPPIRTEFVNQNKVALGGYRIAIFDRETEIGVNFYAEVPELTLISSGAEVALALEVRKLLVEDGFAVNVVSMPSTYLFDKQDKAYKKEVLPPHHLRLTLEAGSSMGLARYATHGSCCIGLDHFGASAPMNALFEHFGFTAKDLAHRVIHIMAELKLLRSVALH